MDMLLLLLVQLCTARLNLRRFAAGLLVLRTANAAVRAAMLPGELIALLTPPVYALAASAACGPRGIGRLLACCACMLCVSSAAAGFGMLCGAGGFPAACAGAVLLALLLRRRRHISCRWHIEVYVEIDGLRARIPALIDTGNRLHDHRSGLPVLICEEGALGSLGAHAAALPDSQLRTLRFGVLGSGGELRCFLPDRLEFSAQDGCRLRAPECLVGVYPGTIPGAIRALAPPEFASAADRPACISRHFTNTARRFCYGFFKRKAIDLRAGCADAPRLGLLHRRRGPASSSADPRGGS